MNLFCVSTYRLPNTKAVNVDLVGEVFIRHLESKCGEAINIEKTRKKKMTVPAGKGITVNELNEIVPDFLSDEEDDCDVQATVYENVPGPSKQFCCL